MERLSAEAGAPLGAVRVVPETALEAVGLPAVGGAEDAPLLVVAVGVPQRRHVNDFGIGGVDADSGDGLRLPEADVPPRLSAVRRSVDAVALGDGAAELRLAAADVDDVRIGLRHSHGADGRRGDLPIGDGEPAVPGVGGFPEASTCSTKIIFIWPTGTSHRRKGATPTIRTNISPFHIAEKRFIIFLPE